MAAWSLAARVHQADRMRRIGLLMNRAADNPEGQDRLAAFHQGLQELGWNVGRNVRIDTRWTEDNADRSAKYAAELLGLMPDIILASGTIAVTALQHINRTLPIVFAAVADPVGAGIVESLAHPGSNATGFTQFEFGISAKWLELLKEMAPAITRVAVIRDPTARTGGGQLGASRRSRRRLGLTCGRSTRTKPMTSNAGLPRSGATRRQA